MQLKKSAFIGSVLMMAVHAHAHVHLDNQVTWNTSSYGKTDELVNLTTHDNAGGLVFITDRLAMQSIPNSLVLTLPSITVTYPIYKMDTMSLVWRVQVMFKSVLSPQAKKPTIYPPNPSTPI